MNIHFIRNIQFTRLIKINGRLREFNFRKLNGAQEGFFSVDVSDDRGNRLMFTMQRQQGRYTLIPSTQTPDWITEQEAELAEQIETELRTIGYTG